MYTPLNYEQINVLAGNYNPSPVKAYNNKSFDFWVRSLFQRACSVIEFDLPENWQGNVKDFFYYCLFKFGYIAVFQDDKFGKSFQPCGLSGYNFYYQPVTAQVSNPALQKDFVIGKDCELIKLTPDYLGIWDIIEYYAAKLSELDNAIDMSLVNSKIAYILGARNKSAAEALKKIMDKVNKGEPAVIYDQKLLNDPTDKEQPFQFLERKNVKESYITSDLLMDFMTILNAFDAEIGIPTVPYQKKERMVTSEAESRQIDATSRSVVWFDTLKSSIEKVNNLIGLDIKVYLRYELEKEDEVIEDEQF